MDLEEHIARLINPEAWRLLDQHREEHPDLDERPPSRFTIESRDAARRVIDGLDILRDYDPQEDARRSASRSPSPSARTRRPHRTAGPLQLRPTWTSPDAPTSNDAGATTRPTSASNLGGTSMKVIYEPKRPRYVVQRCSGTSDWEDQRGYDDLKKARIDADNTALLFPREYVRIIDTQEDA